MFNVGKASIMWFKTLMTALLFGAFLSGCNTIEGAGRDIQAGGKAVEEGAKSVKKKLSRAAFAGQ